MKFCLNDLTTSSVNFENLKAVRSLPPRQFGGMSDLSDARGRNMNYNCNGGNSHCPQYAPSASVCVGKLVVGYIPLTRNL